MTDRLREASRIAPRFGIDAGPERIEPLGKGLINDTFVVAAGERRWVLQRINADVFPYPERIMDNLAVLSAHLAGRIGTDLRIPRLVAAANGTASVRGGDGGLWRLMELIEGGRALERIEDTAQATEVGRALGGFHLAVRDLATRDLTVVLPGFHVTPDYVTRFIRATKAGGTACRTRDVRESVAFVAARQETAGVLEQARRAGRIPERVIHGDPKLDNILFDRVGRHALAIIDLDTVQPGLIHYDIGDCLRSCCNRRGELTDGDIDASFDLAVCRNLLGAYGGQTRDFLAAAEVELLYDAIRLIPFELGLRFLTDHLEGDRWFRVAKPGENLRRARVQFALAEDIERKEGAIRAIIADSFGLR